MFLRSSQSAETEEKKDIFAPVADLMVGVVFIFIIMVMALSLLIMEDAVPRATFDEAEASRQRLADFVKHFRDVGVAPMLNKLAAANERRALILLQLKKRLETSNINVEIDDKNGTIRLPSGKLFENAKADPTKDGEAIIRQLGVAIAEIVPCYLASTERPAGCRSEGGSGFLSAVYIEGHTDNSQFKSAVDRFRNNWDLSAARAIEAFRIISESDQRISRLKNPEGKALVGVSGYADTRPVDDMLTPAQREERTVKEADRRIEVRLIMTVDRSEVQATLNDLNRRLESINADIR
jgi:flagellar motor protein MotB